MFNTIPKDVWLAGAITVGVELSAIHYHVGLAMVVALMCGLCALVIVETIADEVG